MGSHWQQIGGWLLQIAVIGTVVLGAVALGLRGMRLPQHRHRLVAKGKANSSSSMALTVTNDDFTIDSTKDNVKIHISGKVVEGKAIPSQITVVNGEFKHDANTFDDIPAAHKDAVQLLLKTVE